MTETLTPWEQLGLQEKLIQVAECLVYSSGFQTAALKPKYPCFVWQRHNRGRDKDLLIHTLYQKHYG